MNNFVITIGRYCGSGGSSVGKLLAERLGIAFYDRNLLRLASDDSGISEELFLRADERLKSTPLFRASRKVYHGELIPPEDEDFTSNRNLFNYQAKVIKGLADSTSFVVIGRCADYILRDYNNVAKVFVSAREEDCIRHEMERTSLSEKDATARFLKTNKYRREYYRYYTGQTWDAAGNYDFCVSTSKLSYEECADMICMYLKKRGLISEVGDKSSVLTDIK